MKDTLSIRTPENVVISYELAGFGTRFLAMVLDYLIIASLLIGLSILMRILLLFFTPLFLIAGGGPFGLAIAFYILGLFLIIWGYFIGFESRWNGQTPGKRLFKIRTKDDLGGNITFFQACIRNLLRVVDILPVCYLLGFVVMLCNSRYKRLGDVVAASVVIKEAAANIPTQRSLLEEDPGFLGDDPSIKKGITQGMEKEELEFLLELLLRLDGLRVVTRMELTEAFSTHLLKKFGIEKPSYTSHEKFLRQIGSLVLDV